MRARNLTFSVAAVSAAALIAAMPAAAWPFGRKTPAPAMTAGHTDAADTAPEPAFVRATPQQIETELRADPLAQAAFFAEQFAHDPTNARLGLYLSNAQRALGKYPEAADTAHAVLLFAPDNVDVLLAAARAHIEGNNGFYAIDPLKRVTQLKPDNWEAWSLLGVAYDQTKRPDDALSAWRTALKLSPDNPAVLTNMAMARLTAGDIAGAEPLLRTAVAQKSATMQERQDLALVLGLEDKMPEAERLLRQDLPPEAADANLAWLKQAVAARAHAPAPTAAATPVTTGPARTWTNLKATGS
jgi:Flp pilus assembly protein TadD